MVLDIEGFYYAVSLLYLIAQQILVAVLVDALSFGCAMEASEASALELKSPEVNDPGLVGNLGLKASDHGFKGRVCIGTIDQNHDVFVFFLLSIKFRDINLLDKGSVCMQDRMLENAVFHAPDQVSEPICGLFPALCV